MNNCIEFLNLSFRNFLSYGNNETKVSFIEPGTSLIIGKNLDTSSNGSIGNGTGKTTILNALVYALYDKPVSNISKDNLVNNINKKNMIVTLSFRISNNVYKIERARKTKEGNYVKLFENDIDITRDSVSNTNEYIENLLNIPYDLFVLVVVFSATRIPFLNLSSSEQIAMIEHLFSITDISLKAEKLKELSKETQLLLKQEEIRIDSLKKEHQRHTDQITNTERRIESWNKEHIQKLTDLDAEREILGQINFEIEIENHTSIQQYRTQEINSEQEHKRLEKEYKDYMSKSVNLRDDITHLENHECPYCKQHYDDIDEKLNEKREELKHVECSIQSLSQELVNIRKVIDDTIELRKQLLTKVVTNSLQEASKLQIKASQMDREIEIERKATNPHISTLEDLKNASLDPIIYDKINDLNKVIEHQKFLQKVLTKKDSFVRKALLDKNLPFLNTRLREYLLELGLPHKVEFTPELTVSITNCGRELDFGNLSNGQQARVNLSLSLAFRDILQKMHKPINICVLDEVLDVGLDSVGIQAAASLIKRKAKSEKTCMYIISHRDEVENMFDKILTVQMQQGFSNIKDSV